MVLMCVKKHTKEYPYKNNNNNNNDLLAFSTIM